MSRDLTELNKLEAYLKDKGIDYRRIDEDKDPDYHQIIVPKKGWDVICHKGSYGCEQGLLEGMGSIFGKNVEGYLTTADVIQRIKEGK